MLCYRKRKNENVLKSVTIDGIVCKRVSYGDRVALRIKWGVGEGGMGRWGDGEKEELFSLSPCPLVPLSPSKESLPHNQIDILQMTPRFGTT